MEPARKSRSLGGGSWGLGRETLPIHLPHPQPWWMAPWNCEPRLTPPSLLQPASSGVFCHGVVTATKTLGTGGACLSSHNSGSQRRKIKKSRSSSAMTYDQVQVQPELQETLSQINNNKSILLGKKEFNGVQLTLSMCIYQGNTMVSYRRTPFLTQ